MFAKRRLGNRGGRVAEEPEEGPAEAGGIVRVESRRKRVSAGTTRRETSAGLFEHRKLAVDREQQTEDDPEPLPDHRTTLERQAEIGSKIISGELADSIYRGKGSYRPVITIKKDSIAAGKYTGLYGPIRATNANVRTTLRIDYQPDVCKDYKETGYCGFGDTCKFLHDRSDYKAGWQIEREWEQREAARRAEVQRKLDRWQMGMDERDSVSPGRSSSGCGSNHSSDSDDSDDYNNSSDSSDSDDSGEKLDERENLRKKLDKREKLEKKLDKSLDKSLDKRLKRLKKEAKRLKIPFTCLKCKKVWKEEMNAIVTSCKHYFCEKCAMENYRLDRKCSKCGKSVDGILNPADAVMKLVRQIARQPAANER